MNLKVVLRWGPTYSLLHLCVPCCGKTQGHIIHITYFDTKCCLLCDETLVRKKNILWWDLRSTCMLRRTVGSFPFSLNSRNSKDSTVVRGNNKGNTRYVVFINRYIVLYKRLNHPTKIWISHTRFPSFVEGWMYAWLGSNLMYNGHQRMLMEENTIILSSLSSSF